MMPAEPSILRGPGARPVDLLVGPESEPQRLVLWGQRHGAAPDKDAVAIDRYAAGQERRFFGMLERGFEIGRLLECGDGPHQQFGGDLLGRDAEALGAFRSEERR